MSDAQNPPAAGIALALHIGQRVRHRDYKGTRVTGIVRGLYIDSERGLMVDCALDSPIVIPPGDGYSEIAIHQQHAPAHEFSPFDEHEELTAELLKTVQALEILFAPCARDSTQADWIDKARAVIAKATGPITS